MSYDVAIVTTDEVRGAVGEFGDKFRKARERKQLSLDDVANVTKISARNLRAIEEEHFDQLPGGVFNKGFIRAYAKHLGLSSEDAVNDYLECLRQAQIDAHEVYEPDRPPARPGQSKPATRPVPKPRPAATGEELPHLQLPRAEHVKRGQKDFAHRPSTGIRWGVVVVVVIVTAAAFFFWNRRSRPPHTVAAQNSAPAVAAASTPALTSEALAPATQQNSAPNAEHAATAQAAPKQAAPAPTDTRPAASTAASAQPVSKPEKDTQETDDQQASNAADRNAVKVPDQPAKSLSLVIRATENSWISVSSDGQVVTQETLIAPAHTTVHAAREIIARVGNSAGVTFLWNGDEIPAQGGEAEVKTFRFDGQGMHEIGAPPVPQN